MQRKFHVVNPSLNLFGGKKIYKYYAAPAIIAAAEKLDIGGDITFYVPCVNSKSSSPLLQITTSFVYRAIGVPQNRLHVIRNSSGFVIDIDKGEDGGTWSKNFELNDLSKFFISIDEYIDFPKKNSFSYQQW